jgi:hypothetical protein
MLAPDWPPVVSTNTPGTIFSRSAVDDGAACLICSSSAVVIEKLASSLRRPSRRAVPVTTTVLTCVAFSASSGLAGFASAGLASAAAFASAGFTSAGGAACETASSAAWARCIAIRAISAAVASKLLLGMDLSCFIACRPTIVVSVLLGPGCLEPRPPAAALTLWLAGL